MQVGNKKKIVALGTLREDLLLQFDFSTPIESNEVKLNSYTSVIGGSVHNSCFFLADFSKDVDVILCTPNHAMLVNRVLYNEKRDNYHLIFEGNDINIYPLSIIGIKKNGDKDIISCDNQIDDSETIALLIPQIDDCCLVYSSFYEININNYEKLVPIFSFCKEQGKEVMIDLCPLLDNLNPKIVDSILNSITILSGNEKEYQKLLGILQVENIKDILKQFTNIDIICIKRGEKGAAIIKRNMDEIETYERINTEFITAKNTNGCGDVFNAVVICGLVNEWTINHIVDIAVEESKKVALGGLPWT